MFGRLSNTTPANLTAAARRQNHIDHPNLGQLVYHPPRLAPQALLAAHLTQRLPQYIGQKAHQNMRLHPVLTLMPDRPNPQVALVDPKRPLRLRQLHIRLPQILAPPVGQVGPQQIAALAQRRPVPPGLDLLPDQPGPPIGVLNPLCLEQPRRPAIATQQAAQTLGDGHRLTLSHRTALLQASQTFFNTPLKTIVNLLLLL